MMLFSGSISLFSFVLRDLSLIRMGILRSSIITMWGSVCSFSSSSLYFYKLVWIYAWCIDVWNCNIPLMDFLLLSIYCSSLSHFIYFGLKSIFSNVKIGILVGSWLYFLGILFFSILLPGEMMSILIWGMFPGTEKKKILSYNPIC